MSDDLFSQLFSNQVPAAKEKKDSNSDILNSLFEIDLPAPKKREAEIKKSKNEDEINEYISSLHKNKPAPSFSKQKQHYSSKIQHLQNKPTSSQSAKTSTPQPLERVQQRKQGKYMPTVVDIFAKKEDKSAKTKPTIQKKQAVKAKPQEVKSKVEAKRDKIQLKEKQDKPKEVRPTPRLQFPQKTKKEIPKERPVEKQRPPKKKRQSSSSSSDSSSSQSSEDWRKQLRGVTGYNPNDKKFRERDHMRIIESGVDRIFGQDKFSYRMGRREQEEDMRLQYLQKMKKLKKQHRH